MLLGQLIGPIRIEKELGSGAMGSVYRGMNVKTGQRYAVKVMAPGLLASPSALARFEREAAILKQLNHPNIVRFFGGGKLHGMRFYAMEFIEGESLDHVMARRGRMTWEEVVDLGQQLCAALQHAHEKGVIHRDLKPSNLMVTPNGTLKLTDFGIAKDLDVTQLTEANCTVGTAAYMSPEQCRGERDLTSKSDLYSLGVLFYELITGRKPFTAENAMDMFMKHVQAIPERPSRIVLDMPVWLDTLICQMMEKKPEQRPVSAEVISRTLDGIQEKVEAQRSAGVEAVRGLKTNRPKGEQSKIAEEDKDAARMLAGKGKRKKKKRPPFYQAMWFQAVGIFALLSGFILTLYLIFGPPSAEKLYQQALVLMDTNTLDNWRKAREGPIKTYLYHYRSIKDAHAEIMRDWDMDIAVADAEILLLRYLEKKTGPIKINPQDLVEEKAFKAMDAEEAGDLDAAKKIWTEVRKEEGSVPGFLQWGKLAGNHLEMLDNIVNVKKLLHDEFKHIGEWKGLPPKLASGFPNSGDQQEALREVFGDFRFEWFGDPGRARKKFEELAENCQYKSADYIEKHKQRIWYVLAKWQIRDLTKSDKAVEPKGPTFVKNKWEKALNGLDDDAKEKTDQEKRAATIAAALNILALYSNNPDMEEPVKKATDWLVMEGIIERPKPEKKE